MGNLQERLQLLSEKRGAAKSREERMRGQQEAVKKELSQMGVSLKGLDKEIARLEKLNRKESKALDTELSALEKRMRKFNDARNKDKEPTA